jgi:LmbE family N-acetylglucosaminyl deacetylase
MKSKNILILAPHTDDGELGCGGTIAKLIEENHNVYYMAFSTADQSVPEGFPKDILTREVKAATHALGIPSKNLIVLNFEVRKLNYVRQAILEELIRIKNSLDFDLVFMPCMHDIHQDHTTIAYEGLRAFKTKSILGYELIWNNLSFNTTSFSKLDENHLKQKVNSLKEYKSQSGRDYISEEFIFSLAKVRGVQIGCKYAEAFEVIRWIL